jgi:hypothetical protein
MAFRSGEDLLKDVRSAAVRLSRPGCVLYKLVVTFPAISNARSWRRTLQPALTDLTLSEGERPEARLQP